ncbi:DNA polymerase II [Shewanella marina]|uniref:DNA polymerase II n=1 Tax=Shewanella marina TaxID=487319 RepID=UPI000472F622|nr:DNA polymerase II [Shewanella marina]
MSGNQKISDLKQLEQISGRILSRHYRQERDGLVFQYYVATTHGNALVEIPQQQHICFCHVTDLAMVRSWYLNILIRDVGLKSFNLHSVVAIYCSHTSTFRQLIKRAAEADIELFETEVKPQQRYLTERFIALDATFLGNWCTINHTQIFVAQKAKAAELNIELSVVSLDIECSRDQSLYSIGLYSESQQTVLMVGEPEPACDTDIIWFNDELALLKGLVAWFEQYDPDVIIGWAVVNFDLALLYKRAEQYRFPLALGRNGRLLKWKVENKFRPETLDLAGRVVLDGIDWLKAAFYQFEYFSLDFVAKQLLNEGKAIENVANRQQEIVDLYLNDKAQLAFYNLTDCRLVWDIFKQTDLLAFAQVRAQLTGLELGRVGASVEAFNRLYLPHLHRAGFIAPNLTKNFIHESPGGYVMDSIPGLYNNILVLDFKSLYPSIIRTFLIDPKGLITGDCLIDEQIVTGFLGARFDRNQPILPDLVTKLALKREQAKSGDNGPLSQAIKIIMNSLYGVLGSSGCVFHDARLASSITMRGHEIMKMTRYWIEQLGYKVIYGDTDSTFVWLEQIQDIDIDQLANSIVEHINLCWQQHIKTEYNLESFLELEYERHYSQFYMPTLRGSSQGSKKRYVGAYSNENGQLNLVFKGMEQVRSDWTPLARNLQYQLFEALFKQQSVVDVIEQVLAQLWAKELDSQLVFSKRLRRPIEHYKVKATPHVKAAWQLYEQTGNREYLRSGTHIKYVYTLAGVQALAVQTSTIDYQHYIDKQLKPIYEPILKLLEQQHSINGNSQLLLL